MKIIGLNFKIPNEYGNLLCDLLKPLPYNEYQWLINNDEIHLLNDNEFINQFLFNENLLTGVELYDLSKNNRYYMIFVTLMAFCNKESITPITNYKEFMDSDCQIFLTVNDCDDVIFLCKDNQLIFKMKNFAQSQNYEEIEYITEMELIEGAYRLS